MTDVVDRIRSVARGAPLAAFDWWVCGPAPSSREPASLGLKVSAPTSAELSKEQADCSCRP